MARLLLAGLRPSTNYFVQFRATDGEQYSDWSRRFTLNTTVDSVPPDVPAWAPSNEFITDGDTFIATWQALNFTLDQNKDFLEYEVNFLDTVGGSTNVTIKTNNTSYTLTYDQNRAFFGTAKAQLTAKVRSIDMVGNVSAWSTTKVATNPVPSNVASVTVSSLYDAVQVDWPVVTGGTNNDIVAYRVQMSTTGVGGTYNTVYQGPNNTYTQPTLAYATDHFFKVVAVDKFGSVSASAATSSAIRPKSAFAIDLVAPANPTWTSLTPAFDAATNQSYFTLLWAANGESDLDSYIVRYGLDGSNWDYINVPAGTTTARVNVSPGLSYYFQLAARDLSTNVSGYVNAPAAYPRPSTVDTTAPSQPSAPTVSVSLGAMQAQVSHPGTKQAGGTMESDVVSYQVFAGTSASPTTLLGTIEANAINKTAVGSFPLPASGGTSTQTWYFRVKAVDSSGNVSASYSSDATGAVGLILGANIVNATITDAKIDTLSATKLTAGTITAQTINIGSTGVLNIDSTGIVKSNNWSAGTAGYRLTNTSLEINNGSIAAAALNIQDSQNLMHPAFADWEWASAYYTANLTLSNCTADVDLVDFKTSTQSLKVVTSNVSNFVYCGTGGNPYPGLRVEASTTYIISFYAMIKTGGVAASITPTLRAKKTAAPQFDDSVGSAQAVPANSTWNRYTTTITTTANALGEATLFFASNQVGTYYIDGIQIERKIGAINTASQWKPPGSTAIDGGMIRTGSIQSTTNLVVGGVTLPTWSINTAGAAQFGNLMVRGAVVVGSSADETFDSYISSYNYVSGVSGWKITSGGVAEFQTIALGPYSGENMVPGSLSAGVLQSGSVLTEDITVSGALHTVGEMGEDIGIDEAGFHVLGPWQVPVTNVSQSGTTVTLTTSVAHGFTDPSTVSVPVKMAVSGLGATAAYLDGTFTIGTTPTTTTLTYSVATSATIGSTAVKGLVQSMSTSTDAAVVRPVLINFPTDGTAPNIISGVLTAKNLVVTSGSSLSGATSFELGSITTIASAIFAPKSQPAITTNYSDVLRTGTATPVGAGLAKGHNGNYFTLHYDATNIYFVEFNASGVFVASRAVIPRVVTTGSGSGKLTKIKYPRGIVYNPSKSRYYVHYAEVRNAVSITTHAEEVIPYTTSWVSSAVQTIWSSAFGSLDGSTIGWDYVDGTRLVWAYNDGALKFEYITTDGTGNVLTGTGEATISGMSTITDPKFIARVNDIDNISAERIIIKNGVYGTTNLTQQWLVFSASSGAIGAQQLAEQWRAAYGWYAYGGYYDTTSKTIHALLGDRKIEYQSGDSYWSSTSMTSQRWVGYSWYDSNSTGGTHETDLSPRASVQLPKRSMMKFTITPIPYLASNTDSPDQARVYVAANPTEPGLYPPSAIDPTFHLRTTISQPSITGIIVPVSSPSGAQPRKTDVPADGASRGNEFFGGSAVGTPAVVQSSTGLSFWKGDDTAQFTQLTLVSTTDASTSAGNKPPLRVGDIAGTHLRIDGNEILAMTSDTTQSALFLNPSGQVNFAGKTLGHFNWGLFSGTTNGSGNLTVTHSMGTTPEAVIACVGNNGSGTSRVSVTARTSTTFTLLFTNSSTNAANTGASVNGYWVGFAA